MLLDDTHSRLGWPEPNQVLDPIGAGAKGYAEFAKQKIGAALRRQFSNLQVDTGVLTADPNSNSSEAPIAVVCQFPMGASDDVLNLAHKLAWNFSRTALLITLEPYRLIAWSCRQHPKQSLQQRQVCEFATRLGSAASAAQQRSIRDLLHWVSLISGNFLKQQSDKFQPDGRADALLLKNLKHIRQLLLTSGLAQNYCHDLLARVIFTQFLFHRKDSDGRPFFDQPLLQGRCEGTLRHVHNDLASILADKRETYSLFRWLDEKFNGDLFPGSENQSDDEREHAWKEEKDAVNDSHLQLLAALVSGTLDTTDQQLTLWPQYSFDTIPLEFISSVYEEFLNEEKHRDKAYYTPPHLVDFVLDAVLPWNSEEWDLKILDPSCGSGIFLVKAFQRLIHRWRRSHPDEDTLVSHLKPILANNLVGVDKNPEAVRVACFSLYLAMADAIDPKHYLKREKVFPRLRGTRLIAGDFFDETILGIRTKEDSDKFALVLGNAPWGDRSVKETSEASETVESKPDTTTSSTQQNKKNNETIPQTKAEAWARKNNWPIANLDIGPLFIAKSIELAKAGAQIAMLQPASPWLYQRAGNARELRAKVFSTWSIDEIANLSALRWELFPEAVGPACVIVLRKAKPEVPKTFLYICPKPLRDNRAQERFVIEPQDINAITQSEAASDPLVWVALALGGRRDLELIRRLAELPSLKKLFDAGGILKREGIIRGDRGREEIQIRDKRFFGARKFPDGSFIELDADALPILSDCSVDSAASTDFAAFKLPQLLIKQTWSVKEGRFRAVLVRSSDSEWGVICTQSYLTIRDLSKDSRNIKSAWLAYNSLLATYFLAATSSRVGHYRQESLAGEMLNVPLPPASPDLLDDIRSPTDVDARIRKSIRLTEAEWALVEDFAKYVIPEAMQKRLSEGRRPTSRVHEIDNGAPELPLYAQFCVRSLNATFGRDKAISATVFEEPEGERLPVRMIAIHLDWKGHEQVKIERIEIDGLMQELQKIYGEVLQRKSRAQSADSLGFQRVAFIFNSHQEPHGRVRSLYIIKPDERRYWTRSLAMRDADQLSGAILKAARRKPESE